VSFVLYSDLRIINHFFEQIVVLFVLTSSKVRLIVLTGSKIKLPQPLFAWNKFYRIPLGSSGYQKSGKCSFLLSFLAAHGKSTQRNFVKG
jgi:hypothetical protein